MKDDTIKKSDVIDAVKIILDRFSYKEYSIGFKWAMSVIEIIPSADRPQGEWIDDGFAHRCSICGKQGVGIEYYNYCPSCGARMLVKSDENHE